MTLVQRSLRILNDKEMCKEEQELYSGENINDHTRE